jgi:hypothetical protein
LSKERLNLQAGLEVNVKGAANTAATREKDTRPTYDQIYLASRLCKDPEKALTPAAIQKLNTQYGVAAVVSAMRTLRGYTPEELRSAYAYLAAMLKEQQ